MTTRWILASLHLLALGIGLGAVIFRGYSLRNLKGKDAIKAVLTSDNWWGIAALLWIVTGVMRLFGTYEKGAAYYVGSSLFWTKVGLFGLMFALEIWPMVTFIKWRLAQRAGRELDLSRARLFGMISYVEAAMLMAMVLLATAVARGM